MIRCIQTSRQIFQQVHNYIIYRTSVSLHLILVMLWYFMAYSEVLDVRLLLLNLHLSDIVTLSLTPEDTSLPFSKCPQRWSFRKLVTDTIPLSIMLTIGSWLSISYSFSANFEGASATRSQVLHLYMILSNHWMPLIIYSGGHFRAILHNWRLLSTLLLIDVFATAFCFASWHGHEHNASVAVVSSAWLASLITFGMVASFRWVLPNNELHERALVIDGEKVQ